MHRKIFYYIIAACCISIFGCAQNKTLLGNKNESISRIKNYQEALAPDFQFLGKVEGLEKAEWSQKLRGATLDSESLLYGRVSSENVVEAGMIVRTYKILGESVTLLDNIIMENKHVIDSGNSVIAKKSISYDLLAKQNILDQDEKKLVDSKGLIMKDCYLVKDYRCNLNKLFDKSRNQILFFDSAHIGKTGIDCTQLTKNMLSEKDTVLLSEFNQKADSSVTMLLAGKATEKGAPGKQVAKDSGPEAPVSESTELERKLSTLKKLLDNGLITQSDYEKKKADLLEKF